MRKDKLTNTDLSASMCLKRLLKLMLPYAPLLVLALVFSIIQVVATLAVPIFIGEAINATVDSGQVDFETIKKYILYIAGCTVLVFIFQWLTSVFAGIASERTIRDLRVKTFKKLNRVPIKYIDASSHGDLMSRVINDCELVSVGLVNSFTQLFTGIVTVAGTIVFMLRLNVHIALLVILITPLSIAGAWFIAKVSHAKFKAQSQKRGEISGLLEEMVGSQRVVKAFAYEKRAEEKFDVINEKLKYYGFGAMFFTSLTGPVTRFVNSIVYSTVALTGALSVLTNPLFTIGSLTGFLAYANQYTKPFNEISGVVTEIQAAFAGLRRVISVLDTEEEIDDSNLKELSLPCDGTLRAKNVYFSYDKSRPLIQNFNISVAKGSRVAIVGPTGCGKTTLINLLMRFYETDSGQILVSDEDISTVTRASLRNQYGMILQDAWLFKGTIRENIAYARPDATQKEVELAAKKARIHKFIMRLENGYDTMITEDGGNISQGQKQLLCIARTMLTQPPMLILDEATSSIDTRTEKRIQKAFKIMMEGRTCFIIAHRLSTIQDANLILVMNNGNIIESGTHTELMNKQGFYAALQSAQFAEY